MKINAFLSLAVINLAATLTDAFYETPVFFTSTATTTLRFNERTASAVSAVATPIGEYNKIYYEGIGLANVNKSGGGIIPRSVPNTLAFGNLTKLHDHSPYITSKWINHTGTFDLLSLFYGCLWEDVAVNCSIGIAPFRNGTRVGAVATNFIQRATKSVNMLRFDFWDDGFKIIDSVRFGTQFWPGPLQPKGGGATLLDHLRIVYHPAAP